MSSALDPPQGDGVSERNESFSVKSMAPPATANTSIPETPHPVYDKQQSMGPRKHGLERPLDSSQIVVWGAVLVSLGIFFGLVVPFVRDTERHAYIGIYIGVTLIVLFFFFWVQLIDPALLPSESIPISHSSPDGGDDHLRMCDRCNLFQGPRTKHCHLCRKCIAGFDHHCLYLNTCIGSKNYKQFLVTLTGTSLLLAFQLGVTISILIRVGRDDDAWREQVEEDSALTRTAYIVLLVVLSVIPFIFFALVFALLIFHVFIGLHGWTTYEWIMIRRRAASDREAEQELMQRQQQRQSVLMQRHQSEIEEEWKRQREADRLKRDKSMHRYTVTQSPPLTRNVTALSHSGIQLVSTNHANVTTAPTVAHHTVTINVPEVHGGEVPTTSPRHISMVSPSTVMFHPTSVAAADSTSPSSNSSSGTSSVSPILPTGEVTLPTIAATEAEAQPPAATVSALPAVASYAIEDDTEIAQLSVNPIINLIMNSPPLSQYHRSRSQSRQHNDYRPPMEINSSDGVQLPLPPSMVQDAHHANGAQQV